MDEYITTRVDLHDYHLSSGYGSGNMVFLGGQRYSEGDPETR